MRGKLVAAGAALAVVAAACGPPYAVVESVLAIDANNGAHAVALDSGDIGVNVSELAHGGTDLNGDGDATDFRVAHVLKHDGTPVNLGLAMSAMSAVEGGHLFIQVSEASQGGVDLDGDGDAVGNVTHHWSAATGSVTNLGADVVAELSLGPGRALVRIREFSDGIDRNGDSDIDDWVMHLWDATTGFTNLGLAGGFAGGGDVVLSNGEVLFRVSEAGQGIDLNGDGDAFDPVVHRLTVGGSVIPEPSIGEVFTLLPSGNGIAGGVDEADQLMDLNGDGDQVDRVAFRWTTDGALINSGLDGAYLAITDDIIAVHVDEQDQGVGDLNGDSDVVDRRVVHLWNAATGDITNLALAGGAVAMADGWVAIAVNECEQGLTDLNGDDDAIYDQHLGCLGDDVVHVRDPASGVMTNLGLALWLGDIHQVRDGGIAFKVSEQGQSEDLDGDGVLNHAVLVHYAPATGLLNWTIPIGSPFEVTDQGHIVTDWGEGMYGGFDFNDDGDSDDAVLVFWDPETGFNNTQHTLTASHLIQVFSGGVVVFRGWEGMDGGVDLNGDGDAVDRVWRVAYPDEEE